VKQHRWLYQLNSLQKSSIVMRVLQVIDSLRTGGAETLVARLHAELRTRGFACEYYLLRAEGEVLQKIVRDQGAVVHSPLQISEYSPLHALALYAHLRKCHYDIVHVHLFPAQLWAALNAPLCRKLMTFVTTEHSTNNRRRSRRWLGSFDRFMYGQYKLIACVGKETLDHLGAWCPDAISRMKECPNGIDLDAFAHAEPYDKKALLSIGAEVPLIVSVGSLAPVKDQTTLIRAISTLPGVHLALVGMGALRGHLEELTQSLGVEGRVTFLGARSDVARILKTADIYVQSSRWEGFCTATLEAMAAGLPVIASDVPGLSEEIGSAGLLFPVGEHQRLADQLTTLLKDAALRDRLSHAGARRASLFGIGKTADCYEAFYREALTERNSGSGKKP
jgi:glycosyltransferase involved in cell wall biosynthesis